MIAVLEEVSPNHEDGRTLVGRSFKSYAHPLAVLVRMCFLFDLLQKKYNMDTHWWTNEEVRGNILDRFQLKSSDRAVIRRNLEIATGIRHKIQWATTTRSINWFKGTGKKLNDKQGEQGGDGVDDSAGGDSGQGSRKPQQGDDVDQVTVRGKEGHSDEQETVSMRSSDRSQSSIWQHVESSYESESIDWESGHSRRLRSIFNLSSWNYDNEEEQQADEERLFEKFRRDYVEPLVNAWISGLQEVEETETQVSASLDEVRKMLTSSEEALDREVTRLEEAREG